MFQTEYRGRHTRYCVQAQVGPWAGEGNEATLRLQHLCWREGLGMITCSPHPQSCWTKRCGELETAFKVFQSFELVLALGKQNNAWPGNGRGGQNNNMDVKVAAC